MQVGNEASLYLYSTMINTAQPTIKKSVMFKKAYSLIALLILVCSAQAQSVKWAEMESFHTVMSKSFHPTEEGNFTPLKENANLLEEKAKSWKLAKIPEGINAKKTKPMLAKLLKECTGIRASVTLNKPDSTLLRQITAAHETFHALVESCND